MMIKTSTLTIAIVFSTFMIQTGLVYGESPFSHYKVIQERNIFRPKKTDTTTENEQSTEKTSETEAVTETDEQDDSAKLDDISLTGIVKIRGKYKAIIELKEEQKGFYVAVNDTIGDYTVTKIKSSVVTLKKNGKIYRLRLAKPKKSSSKVVQKETTVASNPVYEIDPEVLQDSRRKTNVIHSLRVGAMNVKR